MSPEWKILEEEVAHLLQEYLDHPDRVTSAMRETIRQSLCNYCGVLFTIESLAQQILCQVSGHASIPEDQEYRHALKVVAVGKELTPVSRRMLEIYTGYDASKLQAVCEESTDAIGDAAHALYGRPFDLA